MAEFLASVFSSSSAAAATTSAASTTVSASTLVGATTPGLTLNLPTAVATTQGVTASSIISGASTAFGALSAIKAGQFNQAALKMEAENEALRGRAEYVQGEQEANETRDRLLRTLAQQTAAGAASGISLESTSIRAGREAAIRTGERELSIGGSNAELARLTRQANARRLLLQGAGEKSAGYARAAFGILDAYDRRSRIGSVP